MPANLFTETLPVNTNLEDQRALHLAFELSMLGLDEDSGSNVNAISDADAEILRKNNANGANMTECVPVPSSEHVAEIVGRQGKISSFILLGYNIHMYTSFTVQCVIMIAHVVVKRMYNVNTCQICTNIH